MSYEKVLEAKNLALKYHKNFYGDLPYEYHLQKAYDILRQYTDNKDFLCGIGPEWQGKPMPLILDHINGINNDNRLDNLRFVCSNCDSQLPTYKSRNRK